MFCDDEGFDSNREFKELGRFSDNGNKKPEFGRRDEDMNLEKSMNKPAPSQNITFIDDLLTPPGRFNRPGRIVIILRGPPGSGKTFLAKLIKDKEVCFHFK